MTYTKEQQLRKNRTENPKKIKGQLLVRYKSFINVRSAFKCQLCEVNRLDAYHHARFGNFGADKDDRTLVAICEKCHYAIHHGKSGDSQKLRKQAEKIGVSNWYAFSGERI